MIKYFVEFRLQKRVLFENSNTTWGVGDAATAQGPDTVLLVTNAPQLSGKFFLYDSDYVDINNRGTLLAVSDEVVVHPGEIWQFNP